MEPHLSHRKQPFVKRMIDIICRDEIVYNLV